MNTDHARPMLAYVALCVVASFVVGQGVAGRDGFPAALDIARAGQPAHQLSDAVMLSARQVASAAPEALRSRLEGAFGASDDAPVRVTRSTQAGTSSSDAARAIDSTAGSRTPQAPATQGPAKATGRHTPAAGRGSGQRATDRHATGAQRRTAATERRAAPAQRPAVKRRG